MGYAKRENCSVSFGSRLLCERLSFQHRPGTEYKGVRLRLSAEPDQWVEFDLTSSRFCFPSTMCSSTLAMLWLTS